MEADNVQKVYRNLLNKRQVKALNGVGFSLDRGEICGLVGPNGAGKSTLINIVMGIERPDDGKIRINGPGSVGELGFVPDRPIFYEEMSALNNILFFARLCDLPNPEERSEQLLTEVGLSSRKDDPVSTFSKGMKQRLSIARALVSNPIVLVMDEPFSGLDPTMVLELREIVVGLKARGLTVLLSSHDLSEIDKVCDSVVFIKNGRVVKKQRLNFVSDQVTIRLSMTNPEVLESLGRPFKVVERKEKCILTMEVEPDKVPELLRSIILAGGIVSEFTLLSKTSEEYYREAILEVGDETI
ncbi:MAG: ABC transporter ATP-binding protein [Methanomassiliicoccus sp.]|nr:ABC transporter ATP-binding protein [Methanomassiliicoccus sp.]